VSGISSSLSYLCLNIYHHLSLSRALSNHTNHFQLVLNLWRLSPLLLACEPATQRFISYRSHFWIAASLVCLIWFVVQGSTGWWWETRTTRGQLQGARRLGAPLPGWPGHYHQIICQVGTGTSYLGGSCHQCCGSGSTLPLVWIRYWSCAGFRIRIRMGSDLQLKNRSGSIMLKLRFFIAIFILSGKMKENFAVTLSKISKK